MGESVARDQGFERDSQGREGQDVGDWHQAGMPCRSSSMSVVLGGITAIAPVRGSTHHPGTAAGRDKCVCGSIPCTATTHYRLCVFLQLLVVVVSVCFLQEVRQEALKGDMVQVQLSHITDTTCSIRSIWFLVSFNPALPFNEMVASVYIRSFGHSLCQNTSRENLSRLSMLL